MAFQASVSTRTTYFEINHPEHCGILAVFLGRFFNFNPLFLVAVLLGVAMLCCLFTTDPHNNFQEIQWKAPSNNGGMPISGYKVQRANSDTYFFGTVQCLQDDNSYLTTLPENLHSCLDDTAFLCNPGRKCKYRVLAINGVEDDNFADVSPYLVATAANLPVPPASVTRDDPPTTKTAIEVQWSPVTSEADTGGALVIGYRVYANTGIDDALTLVFDGSGSPSVRSFKHTGLTSGRRYWYQVGPGFVFFFGNHLKYIGC